MNLKIIEDAVASRVAGIAETREWPCRKGCDDCCRRLASEPLITHDEWVLLADAIEHLPVQIANAARERIRETAAAPRPVVCPLLDRDAGACLVYAARPLACRAYGFYAERGKVLGCERIQAIAEREPDVIWGNHLALERDTELLGPTAPLSEWLRCETNPEFR